MIIANYVVTYTNIKELWFVVSPQNPFKEKSVLLDGMQRFKMVQLAIDNDIRFKASNVEMNMPKPSYTADTLHELRKNYKDQDFVIIMGLDSYQSIDRWNNYKSIIDNHEIFVYPRIYDRNKKITTHENVKILDAPIIQISSSNIRKAIGQGKNIQHYMPGSVYEFIIQNNFYKE
jgi:nicotinate-nucleotide adenylyltransferase